MTSAADLERDGFVVLYGALEPELVEELASAIERFPGGDRARGVYARSGIYALRNLFDLVPGTRKALHAPVVRDLVRSALGQDAFCVRAVFLDRTPRATWKVPWHQEATIVVRKRFEVTGFGPWSTKAGLSHVMAPPGTLSAMLTVRLYLDECDEISGAMRVVRASHQYGRLPQDSIDQFTCYDVTTCAVPRRGLLAMRPLLLRSSSPAMVRGSRKVIQLDFCARKLPLPLEWRDQYGLP